MQMIKGVVYEDVGKMVLTDVPKPVIVEPTDAIVRVTLASICSSDLHIKHGAVPRAKKGVVVGHELVGVVETVGDKVRGFHGGERVVVNVETFCGECFYCKRGYVNNCEHGGWLLGCTENGGQSEYVRVPLADNALTKIPDSVSDEQAVFVGDILATGYWAAEIADIQKGDVIAVIGAGPTGLCTLMCAKLYGAKKTIVVDTNEQRLALALKLGLCDVTINPKNADPEAEIKRLSAGRGADVVFEVAGARGTFELAWKSARPSGTVVVVALYENPQTLPLNEMYGKNLTFKTGGVHANCCERLLELISEGKIDATPLITHKSPLTDALRGYEIFEGQKDGCIKWVLTPPKKM